MGLGIKSWIGALTLITSSAVIVPTAMAQEVVVETIPEAFEGIAYKHSGTIFGNIKPFRQGLRIIGVGTIDRPLFPERLLEHDAENIHAFYEDVLFQQTSAGPTLRVPDVANPFDTSVLLLPTTPVRSRVVGTELRFENVPLW